MSGYEGANRENAQRFGVPLWGASAALTAVLAVFYPPTVALGNAGWAVEGTLMVVAVTAIVLMARHPEHVTFTVHLVAAYVATGALCLGQWLAGGYATPVDELYLTIVLGNALIHPARRFWPLMATVWVAAFSPLLYPGDHSSWPSVLLALCLWTGVAGFLVHLMTALRAQRAGLTEQSEAAERMARVDPLTGLENRRAFDEAFARALARGRARRSPVTLVLGDLDHFKQVNDAHGHLAGDRALTAVAAALRLHARGADRAFRWAGDEFVLLLEDTEEHEVALVCSRLKEAVARTVERPDGSPLTITLGWARDDGGATAKQLMAQADDALLTRKRARGAQSTAA